MAPEIVNNEKYNSKVDVWSAGVVAYTMLYGEPPFNGDTKDDVYEEIKHGKLNLKNNDISD